MHRDATTIATIATNATNPTIATNSVLRPARPFNIYLPVGRGETGATRLYYPSSVLLLASVFSFDSIIPRNSSN